MLFEKVAIIGVGLIGGSIARELKRHGLCRSITGCARREATLRKAVDLGVIDDYSRDPRTAVAGADLALLATPLSTTEPLLRQLAAGLKPDCIVTDAGSAKVVVAAAARAVLSPEQLRRFVPGHPIAGTEKSGVEASFLGLFEGRLTILTPLAETDPEATAAVAALWRGAGAAVAELSPERHDQVLAATSHLPHLLAYALMDCLARREDREEFFACAAGGFGDFTRIASSDPVMWRDICLANGPALLEALADCDQALGELRQAVAAGDGPRLEALFARAKQARDRFFATQADADATN